MCDDNKLTSLEWAPISARGFYCNNNLLKSLKGASRFINSNFICNNNMLTSLEGAPRSINGHFDCNNNNLTSLLGAPKIVNGGFFCKDNKLTSLTGIPIKINGRFAISVFPDTPLLKILDVIGIKRLTFYQYNTTEFEKIPILTKVFEENYRTKNAIMKVGLEMIRLGYGSNARL